MKITDAAVQAAYKACEENVHLPVEERLRLGIAAALPHLHPVDVAAVRKQCRKAVRNAILNMRPEHRANAEICDDVIAQTFRALSAEPAQGEQSGRASLAQGGGE